MMMGICLWNTSWPFRFNFKVNKLLNSDLFVGTGTRNTLVIATTDSLGTLQKDNNVQ